MQAEGSKKKRRDAILAICASYRPLANLDRYSRDSTERDELAAECARRASRLRTRQVPHFGKDDSTPEESRIDLTALRKAQFKSWFGGQRMYSRTFCMFVYLLSQETETGGAVRDPNSELRKRLKIVAESANMTDRQTVSLVRRIGATNDQADSASESESPKAEVKYTTDVDPSGLERVFRRMAGVYRMYRHPSQADSRTIAQELLRIRDLNLNRNVLHCDYLDFSRPNSAPREWSGDIVVDRRALSVHAWTPDEERMSQTFIRIGRPRDSTTSFLAGMMMSLTAAKNQIGAEALLLELATEPFSDNDDIAMITEKMRQEDYKRHGVGFVRAGSTKHKAILAVLSGRAGNPRIKHTSLLYQLDWDGAAAEMHKLFKGLSIKERREVAPITQRRRKLTDRGRPPGRKSAEG